MSDNITCTIDTLNGAINSILDEYKKDAADVVKRETKTAMSNLVKMSKATAPKNTGKFVKNIASRKLVETMDGLTMQWYVKAPSYRLTHLLNNGHALRNGGRFAGTAFLTIAEAQASADCLEKIMEGLQHG